MQELQDWMARAGESDETLSRKLGVSRVQVSRIRRGICRPSPSTAQKLEAVTDIPAADFIFSGAA